MQVTKFKLVNGGLGGIEIKAKEFLGNGNMSIVDNVNRERKIMPPDSLLKEIKKLKYYFLNITNHWIPPFNQNFDKETMTILSSPAEGTGKSYEILKSLWQKTNITGASTKDSGFVITGEIEVLENKKMGLSTPHITVEDDLGFFLECVNVLNNISNEISSFISSYTIPIEQAKQTLSQEEMEGKSEDEIMETFMDYAQKRGMIVMMSSDQDSIVENNNDNNPEVHQSGTIDSHEQEEAESEDQSEDNNKEDIQEEEPSETVSTNKDEKVNPFGAPAADIPADLSGDVPQYKDGGSEENVPGTELESLEHSEMMGVDDADNEKDENTDEW
jgi:hypothetical protein